MGTHAAFQGVMANRARSMGLVVFLYLSAAQFASADEFACEKDTKENCLVLSCGSDLNATCSKKECYCKEGACAVPTGKLNNLHCKASAACNAWSVCKGLGLEGNCCPTTPKNDNETSMWLGCCGETLEKEKE